MAALTESESAFLAMIEHAWDEGDVSAFVGTTFARHGVIISVYPKDANEESFAGTHVLEIVGRVGNTVADWIREYRK